MIGLSGQGVHPLVNRVLEMPWWVTFYFFVFGAIIALWVKSELPDKAERPYLAVELVSEACLVIVALGYWMSSVRASLDPIAPIVFVAGCAWLLVAGAREWRRYVPDPEISFSLNLVSLIVGVGLYLLLSAPLLYWGFSYGVRGNVASA